MLNSNRYEVINFIKRKDKAREWRLMLVPRFFFYRNADLFYKGLLSFRAKREISSI
jgi:hypothetical protein